MLASFRPGRVNCLSTSARFIGNARGVRLKQKSAIIGVRAGNWRKWTITLCTAETHRAKPVAPASTKNVPDQSTRTRKNVNHAKQRWYKNKQKKASPPAAKVTKSRKFKKPQQTSSRLPSLAAFLAEQPENTTSADILSKAYRLLKGTSDLNGALQFVEDMAAAQITPNEQTYAALILICRRKAKGRAGRAMIVFKAMKAAEVGISLDTYHLLLKCMLKDKRFRDGLKIKEEMVKAGMEPTAATYELLMQIVLEAGNMYNQKTALNPFQRRSIMQKFVKEMEHAGVERTDGVYKALIQAAVDTRRLDEALLLFKDMLEAGAAPTLAVFEQLMGCAVQARKLNKALAIYGEMKTHQVAPNAAVFNQLILACGDASNPQVERAFELFEKMSLDGVKPNRETFNALISAACRGGLPSYAFKAYEMMNNLGLKASKRTYNELIHSAGLQGSIDRAFEVYGAMRAAGQAPDVVTFGSLIAACARTRNSTRALATLEQMQEAGVSPNLAVYHTVLVALGRSARWQDAVALYHKMKEGSDSAQRPTVMTLNILLDACMGADGAEAALAAAVGDSSAVAGEEPCSLLFGHQPAQAAAKQAYIEAVEGGMLSGPAPGRVAVEGGAVRCDLRQHTRTGIIVALLVLADLLREKRAAGARVDELMVMTDAQAGSKSEQPSKLLLCAQTVLSVLGLASAVQPALSVQALIVDKDTLEQWFDSGVPSSIEAGGGGAVPSAAAAATQERARNVLYDSIDAF